LKKWLSSYLFDKNYSKAYVYMKMREIFGGTPVSNFFPHFISLNLYKGYTNRQEKLKSD